MKIKENCREKKYKRKTPIKKNISAVNNLKGKTRNIKRKKKKYIKKRNEKMYKKKVATFNRRLQMLQSHKKKTKLRTSTYEPKLMLEAF